MVVPCVYCGFRDKQKGRTFHKFPARGDPNLELWLKNMGLGPSFVPGEYSKLCSDHFEEECFDKGPFRVDLLSGSVPTLFGEYKAFCVSCHDLKGHVRGKSFRKFPFRDPKLLEEWVKALNLEDFIPNERSLLCDDHFANNCFRKMGSYVTIKKNAVPTIFSSIREEAISTVASENILMNERDGMKRSFSGDFPSSKMMKMDDIGSTGSSFPEMMDDSVHGKCCNNEESSKTSSTVEEAPINPGSSVHSFLEMIEDSVHEKHHNNEEPLQSSPTIENVPIKPSTSAATPRTVKKRILKVKHDHQYEDSPRSLKKKLLFYKKKVKVLQRNAILSKQRVKRLTKRITTLSEIVSELRKTTIIGGVGLDCLDSIAQTDVSQFLTRFAKNRANLENLNEKENLRPRRRLFKCQRRQKDKGISREKYPAALRAFAMTLHFYSPKAYGFVRDKFCKALPDARTLRSWYSSIDGEPGFTTESLEALKQKVVEAKKLKKKTIVSFMLDEISIKKSFSRARNGKSRGQVDFGTELVEHCPLTSAKDALVMMAVSVDGSWKIPVGYFLINGIDSITHSGLITEALIRLHDIEVEVVSITLDGPSEHFATMRALGANFDLTNFKPFFPHPACPAEKKVFVIFDACHMLKLARNCLGDLGVMKDSDGNNIEWKFIVALADLQEKEGLRAGNKLRMAHIRFWKMKMKVSLAAQTLSASVADSIEFCDKYLNLIQFKGSEATVKFIRSINKVFDFLNSRNPFAKGFKAPLKICNEHIWRPSILKEIEYLKSIKHSDGRLMIKTKRFTPFIGFTTAVQSIINIYDDYVKKEGSQIKYLLTYKFSQDHLELFFCAVRRCGGWCPNPTCAQFVSAYKRLLVRHEVEASNGNVEALDSTRILHVPSTRKWKIDNYDSTVYDAMSNLRVMKKYDLNTENAENESDRNLQELLQEYQVFNEEHGKEFTLTELRDPLSNFSTVCVGYIAGWVVRKLINEKKPIVRCEQCKISLMQDTQDITTVPDNGLIEAKNNGGLIYPSESVLKICNLTEKFFRHSLNKSNGMVPQEQNFPAVLCSKVLRDLLFAVPCKIFSDLNEHLFDEAADDMNHIYYLLSKQVCKAYLELRMFAASNTCSKTVVGDQLRHHLTRQIIWKRQ